MAMRRPRRVLRRSRRRPLRRSRPTLRRTFRKRTVRDRFQATSDINRGGWNFVKKPRLSYSQYRRKLWDSSNSEHKYRSNNCLPFTLVTGSFPQQMTVYWAARTFDSGGGNRFWQPAGGLVTGNEVPTTTDFGGGDIFVRGGVHRIAFSALSSNTHPTRVITWLCRTTSNGNIPSNPFVVSQGWDPSLPDPALAATSPDRDVYRFYKFWGCQETMLKPGESFERSVPHKCQKIDQDQHINLRERDFWIIAVQNPATTAGNTVAAMISWNLSFTADRVI
ncbi:capsid protein [Red panda feces-associated circular DNA virus 14]|uniref:Capsid protein n=1 Tax=Red panda feces-associated circular DNA virus 14 TaxID=2863967 RepID=A0A8K1HH79_9VIRU|nr:capsid protein [Red panda feces-associated circular DNA virus 14]